MSKLAATLKGIIRPFELKEIYVFYYLIDAGEFSYCNDMLKPPLVAYLEGNNIFSFDKMVPVTWKLWKLDFAKNGADGHQMEQLMGKTESSAKNQIIGFLGSLMLSTYLACQLESRWVLSLDHCQLHSVSRSTRSSSPWCRASGLFAWFPSPLPCNKTATTSGVSDHRAFRGLFGIFLGPHHCAATVSRGRAVLNSIII